MWGMHDGMGWWMLFGGVWMLLFWGAVIWLIVWGVGQFTSGRGRRDDAPLEIARRRYAGGEISRDEFEQLRRDLS
jgi:putative membrane protein